MCGIAGILARAANVSSINLAAHAELMTRSLQHRGPDDDGMWVDAEAGIAWRAWLAEPTEQLQAQLSTATEAAAVLLAENNMLRAELDQARTAPAPGSAWLDVRDATPNGTRKAALWLLQLHDEGRISLNAKFEFDFVKTCSTWRGPLTSRQAPIFERILQMIVERTGLTPPT